MTDPLLSALSEHHKPRSRHWFWIVDDPPPPTIEDIKHLIVKHYGISPSDITSNRRQGGTGRARQVAMYLSHKLTGHSHSVIAKKFKKADHTTSLFACNKVRLIMERDEKFAVEIAKLEGMFA